MGRSLLALNLKAISSIVFILILAIGLITAIGVYIAYSRNSQGTNYTNSIYLTEYPPAIIPKNSSTIAATRYLNASVYLVALISTAKVTNSYIGFSLEYFFANPTNQNVTLQSIWKFPAPGMINGACVPAALPALYSGFYSRSNISEAKLLPITETGGGDCSQQTHGAQFTFLKNSTNFSNSPTENSFPVYMGDFSPGIYTVAVGDQWGDLVLLYVTLQ